MDENQSKEWNYHPNLPLADSSPFTHLTEPMFLLNWIYKNWLSLSERILMVAVAIVLWFFVYPSLEETKDFHFSWIFEIYFINLTMMILVAGSLHYFFYIRKSQGNTLKFDKRDLTKNNRNFLFSDQVKDNMFWTLTSGVFLLTAFQVVTTWLMANGYVPVNNFSSNPLWFILVLIFLPIWSAFHFYWVHRLLHFPFLYKRYHALHHRNINIGPWSGLSMHPVEHLLYLSSFCIHWIIATHPIHLIFHVIWQGPAAAMTHSGYEDLLIKDK
ncbi:MAG: desaturase, partial [Rhodobacteraceae bacterium]|nr:desaturase [Paracoccaceae bacterium]